MQRVCGVLRGAAKSSMRTRGTDGEGMRCCVPWCSPHSTAHAAACRFVKESGAGGRWRWMGAQPVSLIVPRQSVINEAVEQISHALQTDMQLYSGALQGAQFGSSSPSCAPEKSTKAVQKEPAVTDVRPSVQALQLWECRRSH